MDRADSDRDSGDQRGGGGGGRVLIASNRGPVSFTMADDGTLVARAAAAAWCPGCPRSGQADVLWVCAALSDADRAAAGTPQAAGSAPS